MPNFLLYFIVGLMCTVPVSVLIGNRKVILNQMLCAVVVAAGFALAITPDKSADTMNQLGLLIMIIGLVYWSILEYRSTRPSN